MGKKQQLENDFYKESAVKLTGDISAKKKGGRGRSEDRGITYSKCTMAKKKTLSIHNSIFTKTTL